MKILITFLTYGENIFGGIEKSILNFIDGLNKNGVEVVIYTGKYAKEVNGDKKKNIYYSDYLVDSFSSPNIDEEIFQNYRASYFNIENELLNIIGKEDPDYILAIDHIAGILPHIDIFSKTTIPIGLVFHMLANEEAIQNVISKPFKHLFCVSEYVRENLSLKYSDKEFLLLPNCVPSGLIDINVKKTNSSEYKIFCNARMAKGKGIEKLIEAFKIVSKEYENCKLYLCGGDFHFIEKEDFSVEIQEYNTLCSEEKIVVFDNIPRDKIPLIISEMDLVVLPSEMETFGLAALEVLTIGIPLLCSHNGNLKYLLEEYPIYLKTNTVNELADKIKNLINISYDTYRHLTCVGKQIAKKYLDNHVAKEFINNICR